MFVNFRSAPGPNPTRKARPDLQLWYTDWPRWEICVKEKINVNRIGLLLQRINVIIIKYMMTLFPPTLLRINDKANWNSTHQKIVLC